MLTTRSSILMVLAGMTVFAGIMKPQEGVAFAGLTLVFWLALQWLGVQWALRPSGGIIKNLSRTIEGVNQDYITLGVEQSCNICLTGDIARGLRGFRISIREVIPDACQIEEGYSQLDLDKSDETRFALAYKLRPQVCGRMELPGVMVSVEDPNGLFRGQRFIPLGHRLTVLPFLIRPQTTHSVLKNNNLQRVLGHHRHKSPGISAELLGIRDYQPGDPPRTIAWKATARLGKLMSCEFESEVPIRSTILCDLSSIQFSGRPGSAVADRVITAVASVARLLLADRDPVATVMATEHGSTRIGHGQGERQLARLMHYLLKIADPNPRIEYLLDRKLTRIVFRESYRRFPRLFDRRTSFVPVGKSILRPLRGKYHRIKCRMAPVLCEVLDLPTGYEFRLIHDADALRFACEQYVRKYPIMTGRLESHSTGFEEFVREAVIDNLCQGLLETRARARDNELFVIVATIPESADDANRLIDVVRVCRAAGHRVIFVDAGYPSLPGEMEDPLARQLLQQLALPDDPSQTEKTRRDLISMGVRLAKISDPRLMEKVAIETELIRSGKVRGGASPGAGARGMGATF